jgi:hypothetical protein
MANLYQTFANDRQAEVERGIRLHFGDAVFTVRRAGGANMKFQSELRRLLRPERKRIDLDKMPEVEHLQLMMRAYARAVVIGWSNVEDADGNSLAFNEENFVKLMTDLPDLWDAFMDACMNASNFRAEEIKEDGDALGN